MLETCTIYFIIAYHSLPNSTNKEELGGFQHIYKQKETINGLQRYEIQGLAWL